MGTSEDMIIEPTDLVRVIDAMSTHKHSREWFKSRVTFYYKGSPSTAYLSQSDIDKAVADEDRARTSYKRDS